MEQKERKPISEENALKRMMRICSRKEYCTFEIKQKLYNLKLPSNSIDKIISELIKSKFIDDKRYTRSFINDKLQFSKWGVIKIRHSLKLKQITDSIIDDALEELEPDSLNEHLQTLVTRKYETVKGNNEYDKRTKVIRFALGRGFNMSEIIKCLDNISSNEDDIW